MTKKYDDIIDLPHHVSATRSRMPIINRAAQFSPFAALTGYDSAIKETARLTDERVELGEDMKQILSNRLQTIADRLCQQPKIQITYFQADKKKKGGSYVTAVGAAQKIDEFKRVIIISDGIVIPIDDIIHIDGKIFESIMLHGADSHKT